MTKRLCTSILEFISVCYPEKDAEELEVIQYGIEGIITTIPKAIFLLTVGCCLKIFFPLVLSVLCFGLLRAFASGVHLKSSWTCLFFSSAIFLFITYAGIYVYLPLAAKIGMFAVSFLLLFLYAPADTEERPLVVPEERKKLKVSSLITAGVMFIVVMIMPRYSVIGHIITWSVIIESVITTPMIYYLMNRRYRNYEYYQS